MTTTPGGLLLVAAVLVPFVGVLAGFALGGRNAQRVATLTILAGVGIAIAIAAAMARSGDELVYLLGGWAPPLGIALRADGLALVMILADRGGDPRHRRVRARRFRDAGRRAGGARAARASGRCCSRSGARSTSCS